jgi:hypothetical protein
MGRIEAGQGTLDRFARALEIGDEGEAAVVPASCAARDVRGVAMARCLLPDLGHRAQGRHPTDRRDQRHLPLEYTPRQGRVLRKRSGQALAPRLHFRFAGGQGLGVATARLPRGRHHAEQCKRGDTDQSVHAATGCLSQRAIPYSAITRTA